MKVRPLHDRVLIRRVAEEEKTKGGIIIPDTAKEKPSEGEIVAVGSGKVNDKGEIRALEVKKGDRVLFGKYAGNEIKVDGAELIILREEEILGIIEAGMGQADAIAGRSREITRLIMAPGEHEDIGARAPEQLV